MTSTTTDAVLPPSLPPRPTQPPAVRELSALLGTTWRMTLKDDERIFTGKFLVLDRRKNVILDDTVEELNGRTRNVGLVLLPGERISTAQVDKDTLVL
ncbi:hypothetical protein P389DRAFT_192463 [Cystobasidium minutum MCA 4210]|uniref:uncharacterized protein n=1 Tax=Cystobasidium minutum MCA 4210 TaxID=1397322 RepID=UPI0034CE8350|eukprot:jgi/Rhomi1/192463/gm1.677_g